MLCVVRRAFVRGRLQLASELNRLEQHPTAMEEERQIIFKQCLMQGVNRYCVLCYTAFVKQVVMSACVRASVCLRVTR